MCIVCQKKYGKCITRLDVRNCPEITKIPYIEGIKEIYCGGCINLVEIAPIKQLEKLDCRNCAKLMFLPNIKGLKKLYCWGCPNLIKIPNVKKLKVFFCERCPWLPYNSEYKENITNLVILQKWVKTKLNKKRLKLALQYTRNPKLFSWFYAPTGPGGKINKNSIKKFVEGI